MRRPTPTTPSMRTVEALRPGDRVVIVGAGPAGLTAAYVLAKDGVAVTVLEGDSVVGGIAQTVEYEGYRFDIGGHRFFTKVAPVQAMWEEVLGEELLRVPRLSRIYYEGRFFDYPLKPLNALRGLGLWNALRILASYAKARVAPSPDEDTFEEWVSNRFGRRLYEIFFKTYTEKVWGIPCTEIRAEWAAQRIQGLSLARAILAAAPLTRRSAAIKSLIHEFRYPRLGPGQMWQRVAERVERMGGRVLMRHAVSSLETRNGFVTGVRAATPLGTRRIACDHVISTMPLRALVRAIDAPVPAEVRAAGDALRYRDFLVVALIVDQANLFPDNWLYIHTPGARVGRIQNFNNWSRDLVPDPRTTCLGMEYFCFEGDGLWSAGDDTLVALATRELAALGLADASRVRGGTVVRMPKAYPVYDAAYRSNLDVVRSFVDRVPNLQTIGRNGMHKYNNQDHSMLTAMLAVANMRGARHDLWSVNSDLEYLEEQRLEPPVPAPRARRVAPRPVRAAVGA